MILYIIRHAWAGHFGDPRWPSDFQRPLSSEGRERFFCVANILVKRGVAPEVIVTSPLIRCRETADILADCLSRRPPVVELDALSPGSDLEELLKWTAQQSNLCREIAWVGHAPDVNRLISQLIGDDSAWIRLAKGAVAAIRFDESIGSGQGELRWLATAKTLGC